jgi:hypothetical protein
VLRHACDAFARAKHRMSSYTYQGFDHQHFTNLSLTIVQIRHYNEKHTDCQTAFANHCAIQSIDSLSKHHTHHTSPPHHHRSNQDTNRTNPPMHPHRKNTHISNAALENPHRLCIYFSPSFPDRSLHYHCTSYSLDLPRSHQFDPFLCRFQKGIYD